MTLLASDEARQRELVPLRMGGMAASPFAFLCLRGCCHGLDLAHTATTGLPVEVVTPT